MRVYVAGPYTGGDTGWNVSNAMTAAHQLMNHGHDPFVPHLYHFMHINKARSYEEWLRVDFAWLRVADAVVRLPGFSPGTMAEVAFCQDNGIPVFDGVQEFLEENGGEEDAQTGRDQ